MRPTQWTSLGRAAPWPHPFGFGEVERGRRQQSSAPGGYNFLIASTAVADEIEITTRIIANIIGTI